MNSIEKIRENISDVDDKIASLFSERLNLSSQIAKVKQQENISIADYKREAVVEENFISKVDEKFKGEASSLSRTLMSISKMVQRSTLYGAFEKVLLPPSFKITKPSPVVSYQGIKGAYSYISANKFNENATLLNLDYFEDVFKSVSTGKADFGVLPIENSISGAVGEVYDLLSRYGCFIISQNFCEINHCLMAKPTSNIKKIHKVLSHPEAFKQCSRFLQKHNFEEIATTNTAVAGKLVASDTSENVAAIGSLDAAAINNLAVLKENITNDSQNKTRFIVIAKNPIYDNTSNHISLYFKTLDKSGALTDVLFQFMANKVNLTRIESRPSSNGEYTFFVDLVGNINDPVVANAISSAKGASVYLEVLGCY